MSARTEHIGARALLGRLVGTADEQFHHRSRSSHADAPIFLATPPSEVQSHLTPRFCTVQGGSGTQIL